MNQLEEAIIAGARIAQKEYGKITGGWWLSHGPESFIEHGIAIKVRKLGFWVYPEASPRKLLKEWNDSPKGRPSKNRGQRFDIVVWEKSSGKIRAVLEIKRAWNITGLRSDREKIATFLKRNDCLKAGYLLAYTEAKGVNREKTLLNRVRYWADGLNCALVGSYMDPQGDGEWGWAIGLYRLL